MKTTGAEAIVKSLKKQKVKHIFGIPGGAMIDLYDELYDSDIRHILTRHEQGAAHMADGYARASGRTGVCMATSGPGATNLVTGIATAYMDSSPIVAFTGQVPRPLIGNDAFQETDAMGVFMPITKHNFQITHTPDIPKIIKAAFKIAAVGRKGPVHIDLPKDVQQEKTDIDFKAEINLKGFKPTVKGHPLQVKRVAEEMINAERPIILAGGGVIAASATGELVKLAEMLGAPVATTLLGKTAIPEKHPLALGLLGMHGRKAANTAVSDCDVLLAVGVRFSDRTTGKIDTFAPEAEIIHIDIDPAEIGKNVPTDIPVVGDAKHILKGIISTLKEMKKKAKTSTWIEKIKEYKKEFAPFYDYDDVPLKPQRVVKEIMETIDDHTIITTEVGQCQMWAAHFLDRFEPRTFISSGGLGTMGFGFPAAIGAKVAKPNHTVIDIAGDGSFLMVCQELATAVEHEIPVIACIMDNRYLGMVRQWQELFYGKRYSQVQLGNTPDFVKFAEAFDAFGIHVEKPTETKSALKEAIDSGKPAILDLHIDPYENVFPMVPPGGSIKEMIDRK